METWQQTEAFLLEHADTDLAELGQVQPCLVARRDAQQLLLAYLRPFDPGGCPDALSEVLTVAALLGADDLTLCLSGRAWSLQDPLPPVLPGAGDLRELIVLLSHVDRHSPGGRAHTTLHRIQGPRGPVERAPAATLPGGQGPVLATLEHAVKPEVREALDHGADERLAAAARQTVRCLLLDHELALGPGAPAALYRLLGAEPPA